MPGGASNRVGSRSSLVRSAQPGKLAVALLTASLTAATLLYAAAPASASAVVRQASRHSVVVPRLRRSAGDRARLVAHGPSTSRPDAKPHFATIRSDKHGGAASGRLSASSRQVSQQAQDSPGAEQGTITFSEFPVGTSITDQYQVSGIDFGGATPFITTDGSNPTSPVLSGTPQFYGDITGTFVTPDGTPRTVSNFSLDVGYIDTPGSTEVIAYDADGNPLDTVVIEDTGIVLVSVSVTGIASFVVQSVDPSNPDPDGWAVDNVSFPGYTFLAGPPTLSEQGNGPNESEHSTTCYVLEPVNCATGTLVTQSTDFSVPGRGIPLDLERTYSSASDGSDGPFGFGWTDSYNMSLSADSYGDITVTQEDGSQVTFAPNGSGGYVAPGRVLATLVANPDGSYTFTRAASQDLFNFSASGQLTSEVDANGYTTKLAYSGGDLTSVTDPAGRTLTFAYSGSHISSVTDPMGRTWSYSYDGSGNLVGATDPMGGSWSFTYDADHLLLTVTDPDGGVTTNTYNSSGQVISQSDPDGNTTTWSYSGDPTSATGGTTTMTDPDGNVTDYDYTSLQLTSVTTAVGTAAAATTSYTYDPETLGVTSVTDPNGDVTVNTYDANGNLLTTEDPLGNVTTYTYNGLNEVLTKTSPLGETTTRAYDGNGNLVSVTDPLGNVTSYSYSQAAYPGDLTSVTDPDGDVTAYTYDQYGYVASQTTTPSAGVSDTTEYSYDADGEQTCNVAPAAVDAKVTCPAPGSPAVADTTATSYDAAGEVTSVTDPDGHVTSYSYDGDGDETKLSDAAGHVTTFSYNSDDELTKVTRPDGTSLASTYDGDGNQLSQSDGAGNVTRYSYDALGNVTSVADPMGNTTSYTYDLDGNLVTETDPAGLMTSYYYDAGNDLTGITYSDGTTPEVSYVYDADGQRYSMTDGTGTTYYAYDADGNLTGVIDGAGSMVSYGYDAAGRLTALSYPNGQSVTRTYDGAGQLSSVTDWLGDTTNFSYDANGNLTGEAYPNGVTASSTFDDANQLTGITDKSASATLATFSYARNALGQVTSDTETGAVSGSQDYTYTQLGQLATDGSGSYAYDAAGDPTKLPGGVRQTFNSDSELISRTQPGTPSAPAADQVASANETARASKIVSPAVTTRASNELVVAFISADGPAHQSQRISSVSGGGLTWTLAARSNREQGTSEIWQAHATGKLTKVKITAKLSHKGYDGTITIATFTGAGKTIGAHATSDGSRGAPAVSLTTTGADSLVWGVGEDPSHATARKPASGQTVAHQYLDVKRKATFWAQHTAPNGAAGTRVKVSDKAPTNDKWNMAAAEITAAAGSGLVTTSYGYDSEGNRTSISTGDQAAISLTYDQGNRLIGYGTSASYSYNGDGLRMSSTVGSTTTAFAWDQSGSVPLLLMAGTTAYIYGPGDHPIEQISGSTPTYLLSDQQGSTRLLTNSAGSVVGTYTYDSYGETVSHTGTASTNLQYDGEYSDAESGYQYLQARSYDPSSGQFLSADPLANATGQPYQFAGDSPLTFTDPSGMIAVSCALLGSVFGDVGDLDELLSELPKQAASTLGRLLRSGDTPELRSFAAKWLPTVGRLADSGPIGAIVKFAPEAGFVLGVGQDVADGQTLEQAVFTSGGQTLGTTAGAAAGTWACGTETVATFGLGVVACPVLIVGGGWVGQKVGGWVGSYVGNQVNGWIADLDSW